MFFKSINKKTRTVLTIVFITFIIFIYFPFIADLFLEGYTAIDTIWDKIYEVLSPFTTISYIVGIMSLIMNDIHDNLLVKLIFILSYVWAIFFALVAIMGMNSIIDGIIYLPHIFIIILHVIVWFKGLERLGERQYK